jgi:DNA-binding PadR family transcriptional regulator
MQATWPSEYVILGLLCEQPMHGYELAQQVRADQALHAIWRFERSEIYFLLGKLARGGLIFESAEEQGGGPRRVIYAPTPAGRETLIAWLRTPEQYPRNLRTALLARVYVALRLDPRLAVELIDAQRRLLEDWLTAEHQRTFDDEVVALVHRLRGAQVEATVGALDDLRGLAQKRIG